MHKILQGIKALPPFSLVYTSTTGLKVIRHKKREQTPDQILITKFSDATMSLGLSISEISVRLGHNPSDVHLIVRPLLRKERAPTANERKLMKNIILLAKERQVS